MMTERRDLSLPKGLQKDVYEWHRRNYPTDDAMAALLGIQEEFGELCRAQLKQDCGIRGTYEEWEIEKAKEAGDVFLSIMNFASHIGVSLTFAVYPTFDSTRITTRELLLQFCPILGHVVSDMSTDYRWSFDYLHRLFNAVAQYVYNIGLSPEQVIMDRWATISKRDFIANPQTGGRELEA
jgi:NTP pyrophosphatase (non-canonical NTP hydrolase)